MRSEETVNTASLLIATDPHLTSRKLLQILWISIDSVRTISHYHLHFSHICAYWIPSPLTHEQTQWYVEVCEYWFESVCVE